MQYENRSFWANILPVTKHLLCINVILWLATIALPRLNLSSVLPSSLLNGGHLYLERWLGLHYWQDPDFNIAQLLTYMFMHDPSGISHIFFNMFSLWMFGSLLERVLGAKRYLFYYISCGIGAALVQELMWYLTGTYGLTVGVSGAVFGILLAFGMIFPNMKMFIIPFPVPIKAKWVVLGYGLLELYFGISGTMDHVAHFAHLGGMLFGIIMILYWKHNGTLTRGNGFY